MAVVTMTLTEALNRRSTLKERLDDLLSDIGGNTISQSTYLSSKAKQMIYIKKANDPKVCDLTPAEFESRAQSVYDKLWSYVDNYTALCQAINEANITHTVTIAGKTMTLAAAMAYKQNAVKNAKTDIISTLEKQVKAAIRAANDYEAKVKTQEQLNSFLNVTLGPEENRDPKMVEQQIALFNQNNSVEIIDPLHLQEKVAVLKEENAKFYDEVDTQLAIANATIEIEVEFAD